MEAGILSTRQADDGHPVFQRFHDNKIVLNVQGLNPLSMTQSRRPMQMIRSSRRFLDICASFLPDNGVHLNNSTPTIVR